MIWVLNYRHGFHDDFLAENDFEIQRLHLSLFNHQDLHILVLVSLFSIYLMHWIIIIIIIVIIALN